MIAVRKLTVANSASNQKEVQDRYYVNLVMNNPHFKLLLAHIVQGTTLPDIAKHWAMQGWITVNERTFVEALRVFRRERADIIASADKEGIDTYVTPNQPKLNEEAAIEQLIRLQSMRIAIDVKHEKGMGKLFNTTAREIEVTRRLGETLAKIRGKIKDSGPSGEPQSAEVVEDLSRLKKDERTRNRLHEMTSELLKKV